MKSDEKQKNAFKLHGFYLIFHFLQKKYKLTGYVVACGLQYGKGENLFHYFFKVDIDVIMTQYIVCLCIH